MRSFAIALVAAVATATEETTDNYVHYADREVHGHYEGEHYHPYQEQHHTSYYYSEHDPIPARHELRHPVGHADFREAVGAGSYEGALVTDTKHEPSFRSLGRHYEGLGHGAYGHAGYAHEGYYGDHGYTYGHQHPGQHVVSEHRYMGRDGETGEAVERVDQHSVAYVPGEHWQVSHHMEPHYEHSQIHFDTHHDTHIAPEHNWDEPQVVKMEHFGSVHDAQQVVATSAERKFEGVYGGAGASHLASHLPADPWSEAEHPVGYYGHETTTHVYPEQTHHVYPEAHVTAVHHNLGCPYGACPDPCVYGACSASPVVHGGVHADLHGYVAPDHHYGYGDHVRPSYTWTGHHYADEWAPHAHRVHDTPHYEPYDGYTHFTYSADHRAPRHRPGAAGHQYGHHAHSSAYYYDPWHTERGDHHDLHYEPYHAQHSAPHVHHTVKHRLGEAEDHPTEVGDRPQKPAHHATPLHQQQHPSIETHPVPVHHVVAPVHHAAVVHDVHHVAPVHHVADVHHAVPAHHATVIGERHAAGTEDHPRKTHHAAPTHDVVADHDVSLSIRKNSESESNYYSEAERRHPVYEEQPHGYYHYDQDNESVVAPSMNLEASNGGTTGFNLGSTAGFNLGSTAGFLQ